MGDLMAWRAVGNERMTRVDVCQYLVMWLGHPPTSARKSGAGWLVASHSETVTGQPYPGWVTGLANGVAGSAHHEDTTHTPLYG